MKRLTACLFLATTFFLSGSISRAEVMIQWFGTTWAEMIEKMPHMAEIGYGSIYVPVPNKAGSQWSVGYDLQDRFDLGDEDQSGTIRTKYGTKHELITLVKMAHRFGIRVYFDNVMNHNSFGTPGYDANTPITLYPDMLPEDFHLIQEGFFFRKSGEIQQHHYDNGDHRAVQQYTLSDLCDISNEAGNWDIPGADLSFVRQPSEPDKYPDTTDVNNFIQDADGNKVYKFNDADRSTGDPTSEDVNAYLIRAARWTLHETKCDGFRFDAAKHVVPEFFGTWKEIGNWGDYFGYCGGIQAEFDAVNGFNDGDTRNSLFDEDAPRDDAMMFAEIVPHANLDPYDYVKRGMRMLDFYFEGTAANILDGWGNAKYAGGLLDQGPLGPSLGIMQPMNHDHPQFADMDLLQTYMILRDGMALIYTDGNNHSVPDKWGRVFPEHGYENFLGQNESDTIVDHLPDLIQFPGPKGEMVRAIWIHEQFVRGQDYNKHADDDVVVNQKRYHNNYAGTTYTEGYEAAILLTAFNNDSYSDQTHYLAPFCDFRPNMLLFNYATRHNWMDQDEWVRVNANFSINIKVPPGHYSAYSFMVPGKTKPWWNGFNALNPISIEQPAGTPIPLMTTYRVDGAHGEEDWDHDGTPNDEDPVLIPRITGNDDLRFVSFSDGLTATAMIRVDEGYDVNGNGLDNPKGQATDVFVGYEPMVCHFKRQETDTVTNYFYHSDNPGAGDQFFAIVSDMDATDANESDFWDRHQYESEYDVSGFDVTQLEEGYHMVRTRLFRRRGDSGTYHYGADIYNTFKQTFYVDRAAPTGVIAYPKAGDGLWSREYGMAFRSDDTVTKVLVHIDDSDPANDDSVTGIENGNGMDTNGSPAWVEASSVVPGVSDPYMVGFNTQYPKEWRFTYREIPPTSTATISVQLHEDSSGDDTNRITTLTRTVDTRSPNADLKIAWPTHGSTIDFTSYNVVVQFTDCNDGGSECLDYNVDRFSFFVDNAFQSRELYQVNDQTPGDGFGELRVAWSNFNAGTHTLMARYDDDNFNLEATAEVHTTVELTSAKFVQPPPFDFDGNPFIIIFPFPPPAQEYEVILETSDDVQSLSLDIDEGTLVVNATAIQTNGSTIVWRYMWTGLTTADKGFHKLVARGDTDGNAGTIEISTGVDISIDFRQNVAVNPSDTDDDDDGIPDGTDDETNPGESIQYDLFTHKPLADTWENGDIHKYFFTGKSDPQNVDTDNDGLPDGLELGIGGAFDAGTDTNTDTDGDGFKNFLGDMDPPIYNTWYNQIPAHVAEYIVEGDQFVVIVGSVTDPANPDTDGDGLKDGVEDDNNNGSIEANDRNGKVDAGETDPNNPDSDDDNRLDGVEDANHDGVIEGDTNNNRVYEGTEAWFETDPLNPDTDGDSLPDGWESKFGLNPLDDGTDNMGTTIASDGSVDQGAVGDPDGDGFNNYQEFLNGTDPNYDDTLVIHNARSVNIGAGPSVGILGDTEFYEEFMEWDKEDVKTIDEYHGIGNLKDGGDVYLHDDEKNSSRDLIAFYARDGGVDANEYYFRVDIQDLQFQAEEGNLDLYIVVDTGNPSLGEKALPDNVNCATDMGWELIVACYQSGSGNIYFDGNSFNNTEDSGGDLSAAGVVSHPEWFKNSYYRADYDSIEIAISRQALLGAGWNGFSPLNFQCYTTRDGTTDSNAGTLGDIGGSSDLVDAFMDDECGREDGVLEGWIYSEWEANCAKLAVVMHGNQPALPGSTIQKSLYDDSTSPAVGYHRALDAHELFDLPVSFHISGTLASAIEWAASDTNTNKDGRAFNDRISAQMLEGDVALLPGPYADLFMPHFAGAVNTSAIQAGRDVLSSVYGNSYPNWWDVFWIPERLTGGATLTELFDAGIFFGVIDQWTHLYNWFGRDTAISPDGSRINEINGLKCFVINYTATSERFLRTDNGLSWNLRSLLLSKAREEWARDQVIVMDGQWEDFSSAENAANYDKNLAWIANHPWIQLVTLESIAKGEVDITGDGVGDFWPTVNRGTGLTLDNQAQEYIHFASESDYDTWYFGSATEESLKDLQPEYETGTLTMKIFGHISNPGTIVRDTWDSMVGTSGEISELGQLLFVQGLYETGFHDEDSADRSRWSHGVYKNPDTTTDHIAAFALNAQSHIGEADIYGDIALWASAGEGAITRVSVDVDQDGELEYVLANDSVYAIFEDNGGRMVKAFVRDPATGEAFQVIGNTAAYPDSHLEYEGENNVNGSGDVDAKRTSGLKDWWAAPLAVNAYINMNYTASQIPDGWQFVSSDGKVTKKITLASQTASMFEVQYQLDASISTLYVRNGLSPNLYDLVMNGQKHLGAIQDDGQIVTLINASDSHTVEAKVHYADTGHTANYQSGAADQNGGFATRQMRNQAYVHQVELSGGGTFSYGLAFDAELTDTDMDGIPNSTDPDDDNDMFDDWLENLIDPVTGLPQSDPLDAGSTPPDTDMDGMTNAEDDDDDNDGMTDEDELKADTLPGNAASYLKVMGIAAAGPSGEVDLEWSTVGGKRYTIEYANSDNGYRPDLNWLPIPSTIFEVWETDVPTGPGNEDVEAFTDDGSLTDVPLPSPSRFYRVVVHQD